MSSWWCLRVRLVLFKQHLFNYHQCSFKCRILCIGHVVLLQGLHNALDVRPKLGLVHTAFLPEFCRQGGHLED